jgi:hypothetical protein
MIEAEKQCFTYGKSRKSINTIRIILFDRTMETFFYFRLLRYVFFFKLFIFNKWFVLMDFFLKNKKKSKEKKSCYVGNVHGSTVFSWYGKLGYGYLWSSNQEICSTPSVDAVSSFLLIKVITSHINFNYPRVYVNFISLNFELPIVKF